MEIEKTGDMIQYRFNWLEHATVVAAIKYLDRQRRSGESDRIPLHSATRPIFTDVVPSDLDMQKIRWIIDEGEHPGALNEIACPAPDIDVLAELMQYASTEIATKARDVVERPIGKIALLKDGVGVETAYHHESLIDFTDPIQQFSAILSER